MKTNLKKVLKSPVFNFALIIGLTVLVLWFSLKDDGREILSMIRGANKWLLVFMLGLMVLERWIDGWGLSLEARVFKKDYKVRQGFVDAYTASLFNNITPSASGGQFAQVYIFRKQGLDVSSAISVLWMDFINYQTTMSVFVLALILLRFPYFYGHYSQFFLIVIFGFIVNSALIFVLWVSVKFPRFYRWLTTTGFNIGIRMHLIKNRDKAKQKLDEQLERFEKQIDMISCDKKMIFLVALSNLIRLLMYYSIAFIAARALHFQLSWKLYIDTIALSSFVAMVNAFMPMPGSAGGTEATFVLMFSTIFGTTKAKAIMILWRVITYYFQTLVGAGIYLWARMQPVVIHDNMQEIPAETETNGKIEQKSKEEER